MAAIVVALLPEPATIGADPPAVQATASSAPADRPIVVAECRIRFARAVQLASERTGVLAGIADLGRTIRAGDVVAHIRDNAVRTALAIAEQEARNDVEARFAQKSSELAVLKYERAMAANRTNPDTVSDFEIRELRLTAEKSLLQYEQAQHQLRIAELRRQELSETLQSYRITSPVDGVVVQSLKKPGELVREGEAIVEVVGQDRILVEGFIPVGLASVVRPGAAVVVRAEVHDAPQEIRQAALHGAVTFLDAKLEPVSQRVKIVAEVDNPRHLIREGMIATMTIEPAGGERMRPQ